MLKSRSDSTSRLIQLCIGYFLAYVATGVLVESHMARPTKSEGNPEHPASLGATDAFAQASVLDLYDPDRSQVITSLGEIRPWEAFHKAMREMIAAQRLSAGRGLRVLTESVVSTTLAKQINQLLKAMQDRAFADGKAVTPATMIRAYEKMQDELYKARKEDPDHKDLYELKAQKLHTVLIDKLKTIDYVAVNASYGIKPKKVEKLTL